jgi:hypothetical protein
MKTDLKYRLALIISFILYMGVIIAATGCVSESSRNLNIVDVPRQSPGETTPVNVQNSSPFDRSKESNRIYSAILDHKWKNGSVIVRDHTGRGLFQNDAWLENNVGESYPDAASDFKTANDKDLEIENRFDYSGKASLIDQQEFRKTIDGGDGWDLFKKNHAGASGIVTFSAVGFDRDGTHALVNVSYLCWSHCGNGSFYILEKKDGEWTVSQEIGTWIS